MTTREGTQASPTFHFSTQPGGCLGAGGSTALWEGEAEAASMSPALLPHASGSFLAHAVSGCADGNEFPGTLPFP